jgi:hypothetical protein
MLQEFYEKDWVKVEVLKAPLCASVISDSCQNICWCLKNAASILKQFEDTQLDNELKEYLTTKKIEFLSGTKEWKIKINTCWKWAIELVIKRSDEKKIDPKYFDTKWNAIHNIIKTILNDSDEWHIMYGHWNEELQWSDKHNGYLITLHRWIPKNTFPKSSA